MKRVILIAGLLACAVSYVFSLGAKPRDIERFHGKNIKITGVLSIVGNEPFTKMGVRTTNGFLVYIGQDDRKKYRSLIAETVKAEGILWVETIYSADRKYKFREFHLSNAVLMKFNEENQ